MAKKSETKRQHILSGAAQAFKEFGFERASMSVICARVGGSKATLYNYFTSKDELFFEVMSQTNDAEFESVFHSIDPAAADIAASLREFGVRWLKFLYSPNVQANRHLAISVSGRSDLGRLMYERGVLRGQDLVADLLRTAMSLGRLRKADPIVTARHLLSLLESELLERFLFQLLGDVSTAEIEQVTDRAIDVFMAAYGRINTFVKEH